MDLASTEKSFVVMVAAATFVAFWATWLAITWEPPIEARLRALRTRRMKSRSEQGAAAKPSPKETSLGFMRRIADRPDGGGGGGVQHGPRHLHHEPDRDDQGLTGKV
jgi:tight adherence protein C